MDTASAIGASEYDCLPGEGGLAALPRPNERRHRVPPQPRRLIPHRSTER
jgi:hypothetical protein